MCVSGWSPSQDASGILWQMKVEFGTTKNRIIPGGDWNPGQGGQPKEYVFLCDIMEIPMGFI